MSTSSSLSHPQPPLFINDTPFFLSVIITKIYSCSYDWLFNFYCCALATFTSCKDDFRVFALHRCEWFAHPTITWHCELASLLQLLRAFCWIHLNLNWKSVRYNLRWGGDTRMIANSERSLEQNTHTSNCIFMCVFRSKITKLLAFGVFAFGKITNDKSLRAPQKLQKHFVSYEYATL